jgi:hypothetical protein
LTRPDNGATQHSSSGPEDRNNIERHTPTATSGDPLIELGPATIEAIAKRVAELLAAAGSGTTAATLIDAGELARRTGISRTWIYQHAAELGAIRLGDGPRARLRFDPCAVESCLAQTPPPGRLPAPIRPRPRATKLSDTDLLPIKVAASTLSRCRSFRRRGH